jgi:hypothetical protein
LDKHEQKKAKGEDGKQAERAGETGTEAVGERKILRSRNLSKFEKHY